MPRAVGGGIRIAFALASAVVCQTARRRTARRCRRRRRRGRPHRFRRGPPSAPVQQSGPGATAGGSVPRVGSRATRVQRVCGACGPVLGGRRRVALTDWLTDSRRTAIRPSMQACTVPTSIMGGTPSVSRRRRGPFQCCGRPARAREPPYLRAGGAAARWAVGGGIRIAFALASAVVCQTARRRTARRCRRR